MPIFAVWKTQQQLKDIKVMPRKINPDECIDCGACEGTCPNGAITEA